MNMFPESANTWKGRILLCFECKDNNDPVMETVNMDGDARKHLESLKTYNYEVIAQIGQGAMTPGLAQKYKIKIKLCD
jgi:hypothetical protein